MKTDDFIDLIAQDNPAQLEPQRPLALLLVAAAACSAFALIAIWGVREDIRQTFGQVLTVPKYILPLIALLPSLWLTVHTRRPEYSLDGRKRWLLAPALITLAMVVIAYSIEPQAAGLAALHGASMLMCLVSIPLLATPILAALLWALKQGACSSPAQTGAIAGIAAGCLSCSMYAFHCIEDSPAFYGVWYTTAVLLVGVAGQQIGKRVLKW